MAGCSIACARWTVTRGVLTRPRMYSCPAVKDGVAAWLALSDPALDGMLKKRKPCRRLDCELLLVPVPNDVEAEHSRFSVEVADMV